MNIVESIRKIAEAEISKLHTSEIGKVTSVFPHTSDADKDNYECNVRLRDKPVELRKVPVLISHIGLANIPHVGDLVLLNFINGDINSPVIIGRLYNDEDRPPLSKMEEIVYAPRYTKDEKLRRINIVLPEKILNLNFYDDRISLVVGKSSMIVNREGEISVKSTDLSDKVCEITMSAGGINISTDSDIRIKTKASIELEGDGNFSLKVKGDLNMKARKIAIESEMDTRIQASTTLDMESSAPMSIKSNAISNIESSGPMIIKGAIVNIN